MGAIPFVVELRFNFIGVNAADFRRAFAFYTDVLGLRPAQPSREEADSWAMLVAGWDESPAPDGHGLRCELFERDIERPAERWWGRNQNVRPSIQVVDLPGTKETLRDRGVTFTGAIEDEDWCQSVEFVATEGVRWSLAQAPHVPAGPGVEIPHLGWVELKAADMESQVDFYTRILGLTDGDGSGSRVRLEQGAGDPLIFLQSGGEAVTVEGANASPFDVQPVWMSVETSEIGEARAWLTDHGVSLLRDTESHDWGGTDLLIQDADGNPLQVVQYH